MLNVVIRVDASVYIGSGHVMRCLVLAQALKSAGHVVVFASRPQHGDLITLIKQRGFIVHSLTQPTSWLIPSSNADYKSSLQLTEREDAQECATVFDKVDLVITDHYGVGALWHEIIRKAYNSKILAIDDLVRKHAADLIIDQTLLRKTCEYQALNPSANILTGIDYAIINSRFAQQHDAQLAVPSQLPISPRVLLSMGGIDEPNATLQVLEVLSKQSTVPPFVTVLLSSRAPHYSAVVAFAKQHSSWLTHIDFVHDMAPLMAEHNIAIGAPGSTSWERACLGLPSIVIALAENQQTICKNLTQVGAAISVKLSEINSSLMPAYAQLVANYAQMRGVNLQLCDGMGVDRIMKHITQLMRGCIKLEVATSADVDKVFDWQCAPQTRRFALNKAIPCLTEHQTWMARKLASDSDYFYMIKLIPLKCNVAVSVGVVRLDMTKENTYTISIFIAPEYYGKGFAKSALGQVDKLHPTAVINAVVLKENTASQALFSSAGYQRIKEQHFTRQPVS